MEQRTGNRRESGLHIGTIDVSQSSARAPAASGHAGLTRIEAEDLATVCTQAEAGLRRLAGATVLVAGGAGFLPSYLVDALAYANHELLDEPCRVICLDNMVTGVGARLAHLVDRPDVAFVDHDLVQPYDPGERVDHIVHAASIASPTWYRRHPLETIDVNVGGTRNLLELARQQEVTSLLYLSSSEIYGDPPPDRVPTSEEYWGHVSCTGPRACYDESKRLAETLCATYQRLHQLPVKVARPFNVYGPRLRLDDGRVIPDFMRDALDGEPVTLYSDGQVTRSFCYVTDAAAALLLLLATDAPEGAYNVGTAEEVTIGRVAELVASLAGTEVRRATSEDPQYLTDNPSRRCPDLSKTTGAIDWRPRVHLEEGLGRTLAHYREEAAR